MADIDTVQETMCCPRCGGRFKHGEPHHCGSARESQSDEGSMKSVRLREQIRTRAYEIYVARGGVDCHAVDDWLQAERELCAGGHCNTG